MCSSDLPLQVTVELGRTTKSISDILDLGPGKIIELNKLEGEPIDVLVNGKYVAKGAVVQSITSLYITMPLCVKSLINLLQQV